MPRDWTPVGPPPAFPERARQHAGCTMRQASPFAIYVDRKVAGDLHLAGHVTEYLSPDQDRLDAAADALAERITALAALIDDATGTGIEPDTERARR